MIQNGANKCSKTKGCQHEPREFPKHSLQNRIEQVRILRRSSYHMVVHFNKNTENASDNADNIRHRACANGVPRVFSFVCFLCLPRVVSLCCYCRYVNCRYIYCRWNTACQTTNSNPNFLPSPFQFFKFLDPLVPHWPAHSSGPTRNHRPSHTFGARTRFVSHLLPNEKLMKSRTPQKASPNHKKSAKA